MRRSSSIAPASPDDHDTYLVILASASVALAGALGSLYQATNLRICQILPGPQLSIRTTRGDFDPEK
jgi:hypothetical protein